LTPRLICQGNHVIYIRWREIGEEPTEGELFIGDSRSKYYWINRKVFVLEKGVLWRKGDEGKSARTVVQVYSPLPP
jgi:hypothetical protein